MERETFLEMYLHRPHAKKTTQNPKKQHLCKVLWRAQGGKKDEGTETKTQEAAPDPRPYTPRGQPELSLLLQPDTSGSYSHLPQKKDLRNNRLWLLRWPQPWVGLVHTRAAQRSSSTFPWPWEKLQKCLGKRQQLLLERINSPVAVAIRRDYVSPCTTRLTVSPSPFPDRRRGFVQTLGAFCGGTRRPHSDGVLPAGSNN